MHVYTVPACLSTSVGIHYSRGTYEGYFAEGAARRCVFDTSALWRKRELPFTITVLHDTEANFTKPQTAVDRPTVCDSCSSIHGMTPTAVWLGTGAVAYEDRSQGSWWEGKEGRGLEGEVLQHQHEPSTEPLILCITFKANQEKVAARPYRLESFLSCEMLGFY